MNVKFLNFIVVWRTLHFPIEQTPKQTVYTFSSLASTTFDLISLTIISCLLLIVYLLTSGNVANIAARSLAGSLNVDREENWILHEATYQ